MRTEQLVREFRHGSLVLKDPDLAQTPEQVKAFYASIYPELTNAEVEGPDHKGGKQIWTFRKAVGTKGSDDPDRARGIYSKYFIERMDGSSKPGQKHASCEYFVLDLHHDAFAVPALVAYARACRKQYPQLSADLLDKIDGILARGQANG